MTLLDHFPSMLTLQKEYDQMVFEAHGISGYEDISWEQLSLALLDELGEFNHELKARWCWWKKTQAPVDHDKALEELVDVLHFVLMACNKAGIDKLKHYEIFDGGLPEMYHSIVFDIAEGFPQDLFKTFALIADKTGFEPDEIYDAYRRKNAINRQRVRDNY